MDICGAEHTNDYTARCHRDAGHEGPHRSFVVGWMTPGYWETADGPVLEPREVGQVDAKDGA